MNSDNGDGSAGDVNYGVIGGSYSQYRKPEPSIEALIGQALGDAITVVNIGAGAGSYEPTGRNVTAIEPSSSMRAQRPSNLPIAIDAVAERLPFPDLSFDASMATFTVHQWSDLKAGLGEMRRVTRGPAIVLTCDPDELSRFWLNEYAPEVITTEARRYPPINSIAAALGPNVKVSSVPIPLACADGFNEAYYGRPERLLDPEARLACSAWSFATEAAVHRFTNALGRDLADGTWDRMYGYLRTQPEFEGALRLIVATR
ncbi:class I SAM-dependent methyltransferase [Mesorhizobium sp. LSHC414A00]|uniref:class I SAM-dependent methyltransferase n=1 Tax=Mesorhizobium sp. LSHC414A00 TaxID=1287287 RepID=UPI0003CF1B3D|nr:class I SAM-dependent methyltransferase [Mesorhizobium sp. LSHC414A00]ESX79410.1 ubiquinone/menaquinone biosynthesis methylase [Mesorhizobium sp. LSHC414A00]